SPCSVVAASNSPQFNPPSARTVRFSGSTARPFMPRRSMQTPSSHTAAPVTPWPPPYTETASAEARGKLTAGTGALALVGRAVGGQRGPGAVVVLAVEDLGLRPEAPVLGADEQFAVPITRGEVEVPVGIARGARERRDHNASPFGVHPVRQRDRVRLPRNTPDRVEDDVVHPGEDPHLVRVARLHRGDVLTAEAGNLVPRRFDEGLVALTGHVRMLATAGADHVFVPRRRRRLLDGLRQQVGRLEIDGDAADQTCVV